MQGVFGIIPKLYIIDRNKVILKLTIFFLTSFGHLKLLFTILVIASMGNICKHNKNLQKFGYR